MSYASTPGQGVVYNVIARDLLTGATSVYVPMVTYSCDFYAKIGGCDSLGMEIISHAVYSILHASYRISDQQGGRCISYAPWTITVSVWSSIL